MNKKLLIISEKYSKLEFNQNNYDVGGGLDDYKFASNRHEDAKNDNGKITLGKAVKMFKNATSLNTDEVKKIIKFSFPSLEWHHAGMLPKKFGGGMKKTYFLNCVEVVKLAKNWDVLKLKFEISQQEKREEHLKASKRQEKKQKFLKKWAEYKERLEIEPKNFYETNKEMNGKYGWFCSYGKDYNMPEYVSGWRFRSKKKYQEFLNL